MADDPNTDNHGEETFVSTLPEDLRDEPSLANIGSLEDLAKGYVHAQRLVGKEKIPLPTSDDDEDAWNEIYTRLGRPEDAAKYELGELPTADEAGWSIPDDYLENFRTAAHKAGLTSRQATAMMEVNKDFLSNEMAESDAAWNRAVDEAETTLRKEFGKTYDHKLALANRALTQLGSEELIGRLQNLGLANDPDMVRMMVKIGESIGEDQLPQGQTSGFGLTPAQAQAEIGKLKTDPNFMKAYTDRYAPGHDEAVQKMQELYEQQYPDNA